MPTRELLKKDSFSFRRKTFRFQPEIPSRFRKDTSPIPKGNTAASRRITIPFPKERPATSRRGPSTARGMPTASSKEAFRYQEIPSLPQGDLFAARRYTVPFQGNNFHSGRGPIPFPEGYLPHPVGYLPLPEGNPPTPRGDTFRSQWLLTATRRNTAKSRRLPTTFR